MATRSKDRSRQGSRVEVRSADDVIDIRDHLEWAPEAPAIQARPSPVQTERHAQLRQSKFFGSPAFRRLWFAQVFSALGDWIGFIAITAIATRIGGATAGLGAVSLVLSARLIPGFFLSPFAGVIVDRYSRKAIMVWCDFGRAIVLCLLPFVNDLPGLFFASLLLELMTMLWSPAKESSVPKLVSKDFLQNANSLSLVAAYGTFPFASAVFAILAKVPDWAHQTQHFVSLHLTKESVALYFDALTYLISAAVIATLVIERQRRSERSSDESRTSASFKEAREGWSYIAKNPKIRSVILGLATGLVGGGMIVPLGPTFAAVVLSAGSGGYGLLLTAMGTGVAVGIIGLSVLQKRLPIDQAFCVAIFGAGISLMLAATMHGLGAAVVCIAFLGLFAGAVYVLGFTILQLNSSDEMRGRVFATLYTLTRACILFAFFLAPLLSIAFDHITQGAFGSPAKVPGLHLAIPGVRITLWLAGLIIISAGMLAIRSVNPSREGSGERVT